jgi:hypothetical protein
MDATHRIAAETGQICLDRSSVRVELLPVLIESLVLIEAIKA